MDHSLRVSVHARAANRSQRVLQGPALLQRARVYHRDQQHQIKKTSVTNATNVEDRDQHGGGGGRPVASGGRCWTGSPKVYGRIWDTLQTQQRAASEPTARCRPAKPNNGSAGLQWT